MTIRPQLRLVLQVGEYMTKFVFRQVECPSLKTTVNSALFHQVREAHMIDGNSESGSFTKVNGKFDCDGPVKSRAFEGARMELEVVLIQAATCKHAYSISRSLFP